MPRRRSEQDSDWTRRYQMGAHDADNTHAVERFSNRSKFAQQMKTRRTAETRGDNAALAADIAQLPMGEVIQVFSVFVELLSEGKTYLATGRRTQQRVSRTQVVVGDQVRFRPSGSNHKNGTPEAVIEQVQPRSTVLLRQDSFQKHLPDPIVANAGRMLVVTSLAQPRVKWGLIDRMLIAAQSGGLRPIICLNKIDLADSSPGALEEAGDVLAHYRTLGIDTVQTSSTCDMGLDQLRTLLRDQKTVLAGHSGVGKSSLIRSIAPALELRVAEVSHFNDKGRHTTTSARRYVLPFGGEVIDTPGIKHFGLVDVDVKTLIGFFPDVETETAPTWRKESYERILESL